MPSIGEAFDLAEELAETYNSRNVGEDIKLHIQLVALGAEIISSKIPEMNTRKAYILGLLHDVDKIIDEKEEFHGLSGYRMMMDKGYDDVAKICLTHSFTNKDFKITDFGYNQDDMQKCKEMISQLEYDDYARLIQLCDLLVNTFKFDDMRKRFVFIKNKYNVSIVSIKDKYRNALKLKYYFDKKCGCDIYKLLGVV